MSFVFLINVLSIFITVSFFLELFLLNKIDLDEEEKFNMNFIIICSGLAILIASIGRLVWGEGPLFEFMISGASACILSIWFILILCCYNYFVERLKWKKDIKKDKKDYFKHI